MRYKKALVAAAAAAAAMAASMEQVLTSQADGSPVKKKIYRGCAIRRRASAGRHVRKQARAGQATTYFVRAVEAMMPLTTTDAAHGAETGDGWVCKRGRVRVVDYVRV